MGQQPARKCRDMLQEFRDGPTAMIEHPVVLSSRQRCLPTITRSLFRSTKSISEGPCRLTPNFTIGHTPA
jgi:hypothetical protein